MLYLEDYLEIIENLPIEMRDKFTEMREMDLQVSNATDSLENKVEAFFKNCASLPNLKQDWKDEQMAEIRAGYSKALDDADEKVQLANQIYDLIERHLRKLDQEVNKFKMELEADHAGITEIIEKRSLDSEKNSLLHNHSSGRPEKRKYHMTTNYLSESPFEKLTNNSDELLLDPNFMFGGPKINCISPTPNLFEQLGTAGGNTAIAVAASRAIGATLEMPKGRRTASLKASYEAVTKTVDMKDISPYPRSEATRTPSLEPAPSTYEAVKSSSRQKKPTQKSLLLTQANYARQQQHQQQHSQHQISILDTPMLATPSPSEGLLSADGGMGLAITPQQEDPTEPRYCLCNDVSYGDMVGCDNEDCPFEWFHYGCVGLQQAPRGKWYCPQCLANMRRRSRK